MIRRLVSLMGLGRKAQLPGIAFAAAIPRFLESRRHLNLRHTTMDNYGVFAKTMIRMWGGRSLESVTTEEWLALEQTHSRNFAEHVQTLMRWAFREKLIPHDVTAGRLPRLRREDSPPPVRFSPSEAQRFYNAVAEDYKAAFALAMYAGIRPYEVCRLDWSAVHVTERRIKIAADVSKIRRARIIEGVPTILWAQLALREQRSGPFIPRGPKGEINVWRWIIERRRAAERSFVTLSHDVLRHSFATYFVALTGSPDRAAKILGHYDLRMLAEHYDGIASKAEAEEYFHPKPILALPAPPCAKLQSGR